MDRITEKDQKTNLSKAPVKEKKFEREGRKKSERASFKINWVVFLRQIHGATAGVIGVFFLMYFVTAFIMTQGNLFKKSDPFIKTYQQQFNVELPETLEDAAVLIQNHFNLRGKRHPPMQIHLQKKGMVWKTHLFQGVEANQVI